MSVHFALRSIVLWTCSNFAASTDCTTETGVCYQGSNLAITLDVNSIAQGCQEVGNAAACCTLCAQYWPQCLSWQFIIEGNNDNGYAGMAFYCCLKGSFRPSPLTAAYCASGYFNPQCTLTSACNLQLTGTSVSDSSAIVAGTGTTCGDASNAISSWDGISNPANATSYSNPTAVFDLGTASGGAVGDYLLCHSPIDDVSFPEQVGTFTMKGPNTGQALSCTLGVTCILILSGFSLSASPANYHLVITSSSCGTGLVAASFAGSFENPRAVWDNNDDNYYEMKIATEGDTSVTYRMCWAANPSSLNDYILEVGSFNMNGPSAGMSHSCTMGQICTITLQGYGFTQDNGVLAAFGVSGVCPLLGDELVASFGASFVHPASSAASPYTQYSLGSALNAHNNQPGSGYRLCWSGTPSQTPPLKVNTDYNIDAGLFTLNGPAQSNHECVLTLSCSITLTGSGLSITQGLLLLEEGSACGSAASLASASGGDWANPVASTTGSFSFGKSTVGLPKSSYVICWAAGPSTQTDYTIPVGTLQLGGPNLLAGSSCVKGENCVITLTGIAFASTNKLLVVDIGSACGSSAAPATFSSSTRIGFFG